MSKVIFISHAGTDANHAKSIAQLLEDAQIDVRFDRELELGDSFISFMEDALSSSDYFLLLWSEAASRRNWVRLEWEAALYRSVQEARSFIVIGRLEPFRPPALLAPRLMLDLFPEYHPGIQRLINLWCDDRRTESTTGRPVASSGAMTQVESGETTVYITSDLFGITVPIKLDLDEPAGILLDRIISSLELPNVLDYKGLIGVRFDYTLVHKDRVLSRGLSLANQEITEKVVLWLETTMTPYSHSKPVQGKVRSATYRVGNKVTDRDNEEIATNVAHGKLLDAIVKNGLGWID